MQQLTFQQLLASLKEIVKEKNITQEELARRTGFAQGNISRIFSAKYPPQLDHFLKLINAANVSLAEVEERALLSA